MSKSRSHSPRRGRHVRASHSRSHHRGRHMSTSRSPSLRMSVSLSRSCSPRRDRSRSESRSMTGSLQRDASHSQSPSQPVIGKKRSHSPSGDSDDLQVVKAQKVSERGGQPKASDYDDVAKEVILRATAVYRCLVSTTNAFPTPAEEGDLIKRAWSRANEETSQDVPIALTPVIAKLVGLFLCYVKRIYLVAFLFRFRPVVVKSGVKSNLVL